MTNEKFSQTLCIRSKSLSNEKLFNSCKIKKKKMFYIVILYYFICISNMKSLYAFDSHLREPEKLTFETFLI